jgi:1,4-alpha-glucan branching enzyme
VNDVRPEGFQWIEANDVSRSTLCYLRSAEGHPPVLVVCNFTPEVWRGYQVGAPTGGHWKVIACSDEERFGGSGNNPDGVDASEEGSHGMSHSLRFDVPPMSVTLLQPA